MFRILSIKEKTIIKRAFNKWGIFGQYDGLYIIAKTCDINITEQRADMDTFVYNLEENLKENEYYFKYKKNGLNDSNSYTTTTISSDIDIFVCSNEEQMTLSLRLQPSLSGLKIGKIKNKRFLPNLNFAELVVQNNFKLNYPYVILDDNGSHLVIYGRDIMGNSIISYNKEIKENEYLIILNNKREVLGIGRSRFKDEKLVQNQKITIDNLQNIGTYYLKQEDKGIF